MNKVRGERFYCVCQGGPQGRKMAMEVLSAAKTAIRWGILKEMGEIRRKF
jgi:hypothetical protein